MEYLDNIITRLAEKCTSISPSVGYDGPFIVDTSEITVDSDQITVDSTIISVDETIYV
jgi:hypothetical protein